MTKPKINWKKKTIIYKDKVYYMQYQQTELCIIGISEETENTLIYFLNDVEGTTDNCIIVDNEMMTYLSRAIHNDANYWCRKEGITEDVFS